MANTFVYKPIQYFTLVFLITYALWLAGAYVSYQPGKEGLYIAFMLPGLMTPFIISLFIIFTAKTSKLKNEFFDRLFNLKRVQFNMLPAIFLLMPLIVLISIAISLVFGGSMSQFQLAEGFSFSSGVVPVLLVLILAAAFEELGWRGYAFDSLQSRFNVFTASVIFSILWSMWHLPLLLVKDSYQFEIYHENIWFAVNFFVSIIPMGIIISWICLKNNKSIFVAILFHFIINMSQEMLDMTQQTKSIETVVLFVVLAIIIVLDKQTFFPQQRADTSTFNKGART